jgi:hypothetical protein
MRSHRGENWADTLRREVREEACATVTGCRLLGFSRRVCVRGSQAGLVLVRALWRAGRQRAVVCGARSASTVSSPVGGDCRVGAPAASSAWTVPG